MNPTIEQQLEAALKENTGLKAQLSQAESATKAANEKAAALETKVTEIASENASLREKNSTLEKSLQDSNAKVTELTAKVSEVEKSAATKAALIVAQAGQPAVALEPGAAAQAVGQEKTDIEKSSEHFASELNRLQGRR